MPTNEHLAGQWREWRHTRVAELTRPYGWTALVAQFWLHEGTAGAVLEGLPGTWAVSEGRVLYTPPVSGPNLSVNGEYPSAPVEIPTGRNQTYGHGGSVPVYFGDREVETVPRTNDAGDRILGVRVRDPHVSVSAAEIGLTAFEYDPAWRIPSVFTPSARNDIEAVTVETGVRETTTQIGTLAFSHGGTDYEVVLIGKDSAHGVQPVAHIRDRTSGPVSYGAGRVVELQFSGDGAERIDFIDFNYAHALPCAVTNFVTCPLPPRQNHLDFEVLAGEKKPANDVARVLTYEAPAT
ncbi:DUF1684 domain-containing protein [Leucobacter chromiireducens]|uniref:DUF1684 domain-containing protein n=1 Tax=Leucobacter chromiireducens subsp. chromiireducens TaxID=660067 RepID=A0ABS1STP8_9MICO|nr:DUF1684 domain-containing protein [Leucobacter chromiireducens]MBL3690980.1 DUF1684 domain-containing protein [Leucobacter chromiireducens subsp. chromiireducens]